MGSGNSKKIVDDDVDGGKEGKPHLTHQHSVFKKFKTHFEPEAGIDYSQDPNHYELRFILEYPVGQKHLGEYMRAQMALENLFCWVDVHEYRDIPTKDFRRCCGMHIYQKYLKVNAGMALGSVTDQLRIPIKEALEQARENPSIMTKELFDPLYATCFKEMAQGIFVKFKNDSEKYAAYRKDFEDSYNKVVVDDFDYMGIIGHGGFGRVVHVRKRSTGLHYAMKIQPKTELLAEYKGDEDSLQTEKTVFAQCHHPFVVDLAYSIQTDSHAILVLGLVRGGDLEDAIKAHGRLSEERTWLYSAEILLALQHMHDLGLLYRDLKPCNVLLGDDGHVQLTDMGLAAEIDVADHHHEHLDDIDDHLHPHPENEKTPPPAEQRQSVVVDNGLTPVKEEKKNPITNEVFVDPTEAKRDNTKIPSRTGGARREKEKEYRVKVLCKVDGDSKPDKRKSICGTPGFMAPELDGMKNLKRREREGYGVGVDYFALGVTAYYMIAGHLPNNTMHQYGKNARSEKVSFPGGVSENCQSFILDLMEGDSEKRLGCGPNGREDARNHKWFTEKDLHWDLLMAKAVEPPFIPKLKAIKQDAKPKYQDYLKMMEACAARFGNGVPDLMSGEAMQVSPWDSVPNANGQKYFDNWDYISPFTYKMELGLEESAEHRGENVRESVKELDELHRTKSAKASSKS